MKKIKKVLCFICSALLMLAGFSVLPNAALLCNAQKYEMDLDAKSVILIEASSGNVLYEANADTAYPPASVTKIMTLLLVFEALDEGKISWDDTVCVSETAASMGGSQVFLEVGEEMSMSDMLKSVIIASANDAAVALAEHVAGSIEGFVSLMNQRAKELQMNNTVFYNPTGLDDSAECNMTSARDISIMSRELLKHEKVLEYTVIWMDSIRDGAFGLTNTNRLIRFYNGANGLKTGSTSRAGFCISATALRDGMQLIAVVMGSPNKDVRNNVAKKLLDYGFANYSRLHYDAEEIGTVKVLGGVNDSCRMLRTEFNFVTDKSELSKISCETEIPESIDAPINAGDVIGKVNYKCGDEVIGTADILAAETVDRISFFQLFTRLFKRIII